MTATTFTPSSPSSANGNGATTLSQRAMLACLNVSYWRANKLDRKASQEVCHAKGTDDRAARVHKSLLPEPQDAPEYAAIEKAANAMGVEFRKQTLPWGEGANGVRVLPAANYLPLGDAIRPMRAQFEAAVERFLIAYPSLKEAAKIRLNGLYREEDYPTGADMRARFRIELSILPFPDSSDFRVSLGSTEVEAIRAQIEADAREAAARGSRDLFDRFRSHMERMAERLAGVTKKQGGEKIVPGEFRDTLVDNLKELCELLPRLNLTADPLLDDLVLHAQVNILDRIRGVEDLRAGQQVKADGSYVPTGKRAEVLAEVESILRMIPGR